MHVVGRRMWPDFLVDLLMDDKDPWIVFPHARVSQADPCGGEEETLASFGSRVLTARHLTTWSGSVRVISERRAWRMLFQEDNILPDD